MIAAALAIVAILAPARPGSGKPASPLHADDVHAAVNLVAPGGPAEKVLLKYNEFIQSRGMPGSSDVPMLRDLMTALYPLASEGGVDAHKVVAHLICQGLDKGAVSEEARRAFDEKGYAHWKISDEMSMAMAHARDLLIEEAILDAAAKLNVMVGRSDSGNPKSGMRSDLDQTFFAFKLDEAGAASRDEKLDTAFKLAFEEAWRARNPGLELGMLDVVSIEGKNRFPDPRSTAVHLDFQQNYHATLAELRNIKGAYTTYGAVMQQVQRRMMQTLRLLQESGDVALLKEKGRIWQEYGPEGKTPHPDFRLAERTMFFAPADLLPDATAGAAVANYLELQHYMHAPKFAPKYHLRTFDDALFSLRLMKAGRGLDDKIDYDRMGADARKSVASEILADLFPGDAGKQREHLLALEISCDLRLEHAAEKPDDLMKVEAFRRHGSVPGDADLRNMILYQDLARALEGEAFRPEDTTAEGRARTREQIRAAERHYRELASELCLESINKTAGDALAFFTDPSRADSLLERVRPLMEKSAPAGTSWDATKANIAESARITFLYAIYDLGLKGGADLIRRLAPESGASDVDLLKIYLRGQVAPLSALRANPEAYLRPFRQQTAELAERVWLHQLTDLGFVKLGAARLHDEMTAHQKLVWSPGQFARNWARNAFWDKGSVASLADVARTYFLSKGDVDQVRERIQRELLLAVPVIGQLVTIYDGGVQEIGKLAAILKWPGLGYVVVAYSVGDAAYAIYQVEVGQPAHDNVVDALYRGFAGPETVAYGEPGKPPPVWTDADEKELANLRAVLAAAHPTSVNPPVHSSEALRAFIEKHAQEVAAFERTRAAVEPGITRLSNKKRDFEQFRDGSWAGGYFTESSAVHEQKWLSTSLLADITPRYGFVTSGAIDFDDRLPQPADGVRGTDPGDEIAAAVAQFERDLRGLRRARADRYWTHAHDRKPELLARLRRDSVWRWSQENRINLDAYVDAWVAKHGEALARDLEKHGLLFPRVFGGGRIMGEPIERTLIYSIGAYTDALKERLREDHERSRQLTAAYLTLEKGRLARNAENLEKARRLFQNEQFGLAVAGFAKDEGFRDFLAALRLSAVRREAPKVAITFHAACGDPKALQDRRDGQPLPAALPLRLSVTADVVADETIYHPPYALKHAVLGEEARAGLDDAIDGVPLRPEVKSAIARLQARHRVEISKGLGVIAVGSVLAHGMSDLAGAIPATVAHLPGREAAARGEPVVMGQQCAYIPSKPLRVRADPIRVRIVDKAGRPFSSSDVTVKIGAEPAQTSQGEESWGTHEFTRFGETIEIAAVHALRDGSEVRAAKPLAIDDLKSWVDPQPPEPVVIELPVFAPGAFTVAGDVVVRPPPDAEPPGRCKVGNATLAIDSDVEMRAGRGRFDIKISETVRPGSPIELSFTAFAGGVRYSGRASRPVPDRAGRIDFGTVTLAADTTDVVIPGWDAGNPPTYEAYAKLLAPLGLTPRPVLGPLAPQQGFDHRLNATKPAPGTRVARGTDVTVQLFGKYARVMPDVTGWTAAEAVKHLRDDLGLDPAPSLGPAPERSEQEFRVKEQTPAPGALVEPGASVALLAYGRFVPAVAGAEVPLLVGRPIPDAERVVAGRFRIEEAGREEVAANDPAANRIFRQDPMPPTRLASGATIRVWVKAARAGEAVVHAGPQRPYYVVFGLTVPHIKPPLEAPKEQPGESWEDHHRRLKAFLDGLKPSDVTWQEDPQWALCLHFSGAGLDRYPVGYFVEGKPYAMGIDARGRTDDGRLLDVDAALLLTARKHFERLEDALAAFPTLKKGPVFHGIAFTRADGLGDAPKASRPLAADEYLKLGPITHGWTDKDRKKALGLYRFMVGVCFVATAVYVDPNAREVTTLRRFRDRVLLASGPGRRFVDMYYRHGPGWAREVARRPMLARGIRRALDAAVWAIDRVDLDSAFLRNAAAVGAACVTGLIEGAPPRDDPNLGEPLRCDVR